MLKVIDRTDRHSTYQSYGVDRNRGAHCNRSTRLAFTLLELLLALAVMTAITAVVLPQFDSLLGGQRLERAADQMRIEVTQARIKAMRDGRVYLMEMEEESGKFQLRPYSSLSDATETMQANQGTSVLVTGAKQASMVTLEPETESAKELELPENVVFGQVVVKSAARSAEIEQNQSSSGQIGSGSPLLFYPDGTTSTAAVELKHEEMGTIVIKVRGITGEVVIGQRTGTES